MTPERWQQVKAILDSVDADTVPERHARIREACGADTTLLSDVESFLEFADDIEEFIEDPLWSITNQAVASSGVKEDSNGQRRIGPYRIERILGRGGMGTVFLAVREDDYEQEVALKLVSWGMDSEEILSRFITERQILANLQHPGIARILDGGTTDDGMPYFVMEYVEGEPIDRYCDRRQLSLRDRLELFGKVCSVIQYAHQNLVVHRDLKPSNILVTQDGEPKLLDFGIAKLLEPDRASHTVATGAGQGPMTPDYASPEQILNTPITTACDVYALGVLLYRMLTGSPPYHLAGKGYAEIVNLVCLTEPRRPSTAVGSGAGEKDRAPKAAPEQSPSSRVEDQKRRRQLRGDLDAIVMKAMRKEPRHRYGSAVELAGDVERHLDGLPVQARQGTWVYVGGKFVRRHKLGLVAVMVILIFAVTTTVLWRHAVYGQEEAERERARVERLNGFLEGLFTSANPNETKGEDLTVRELLDRGREKVDNDLMGDPEIQAEMWGTLGIVFNNLGLYDQARELKEKALQARLESATGDSTDIAIDMNNLAKLFYDIGDYKSAERYWSEALSMRRKLRQSESDLVINISNLAMVRMYQGRYSDAKKLHLEALKIRRETFGSDHPRVARSLHSIGMIHYTQGQFDQAEPLLRQALAIRERHFGPEHTLVASVLSSLGSLLHLRGDRQEARQYLENALSIRRKFLGAGHIDVANSKKSLAALLLEEGETHQARLLLEESLEVLRRSKMKDDWVVADAESVWGFYLLHRERYEEAEPFLMGSYEIIRDKKGEKSIYTWLALSRLVRLYEVWGRAGEATKHREQLFENELHRHVSNQN